MRCERFKQFRQETYQLLGKAHDATFELMDSVMTTKNASCLGEFSLSPLFRRKWSSTYEALQDIRLPCILFYFYTGLSQGVTSRVGLRPGLGFRGSGKRHRHLDAEKRRPLLLGSF